MANTGLDIGAAVLAATQGMTAFYQFMPRIADVRKADVGDPTTRGDVRMGEFAATGVTLGTGIIVSAVTKNKLPLLIAGVTVAGFVFLYEMALRGNRLFENGFNFGAESNPTNQTTTEFPEGAVNGL